MGQKKKNGRVGIVMSVLLCAIFIPIILVNVIMIVKTYTDPDHLPGVFGVKPAIVLSGSMSPLFEPKALIFAKQTETAALREGDVICFLQKGTAITHRIQRIETKDGQTLYFTKGDANNAEDTLPVKPEQVEGRYIGQIAGLGGFAMFMQSTTGMILFIALPVLLYLVFDVFSRRKENRYDRERARRLEKELAALRAEQAAIQAQDGGLPPP